MYAFAFVAQNFINYHFVDIFHDSDLQRIIENKLKLYDKKHLSNTVKALRVLTDELVENEVRYKAVKELWGKAVKLTMQEARGEAGHKFVKIAIASDELKKAFDTDADKVRLSAWTICRHLHHDNITAFDYSIIPFMIENKNKELYKDGEKTYIVAGKMNVWYRLALKICLMKKKFGS